MDLSFSVGWSRKQRISLLTVWGPPECEEEGGWILCQVSKQMKNTGRNQSCRAGEEEEEEALQPFPYFPVLWLVLSEGMRALAGAALASKLHHSLQSECWGCCCVQHIPVLILSSQNLTVLQSLYPVVLPLQVWIFSHQLLAGGFVAGWMKRGAGCCMLSWRQKHVRHGTALSQRDKNIRRQVFVPILLYILSAFCYWFVF